MNRVIKDSASIARFVALLQPIVSVLFGLCLGLLVTAFAGESPIHVLQVLIRGAVGSQYDLGMSLFYATPLIFTGLSVSIAFHAGLFNIGAEGQLLFGALAVTALGVWFPGIPVPLAVTLGVLAAFVGGAMWGADPGWLRARRGSHEVINTIMLNFVASGLASWFVLYPLRNLETQNPESLPIGEAYRIPHLSFFPDTPASFAFPLALLMAVAVWFFLWKTVKGYEIRAVGENETAARAAGIDSARARILAMTLAGGLAGLVGVAEVMGSAHKFKLGFSPDYGFIGIAVALLGRNRPAGIVAAALLFGALHKGAADLDLETENVTRELSLVLQALIILSVSADGLWTWMKRRRA